PLDGIGDIEPDVLRVKEARPDPALGIIPTGFDPIPGDGGMLTPERPDAWDPRQQRRGVWLLIGKEAPRDRPFGLQGLCRTPPAVMEHLRPSQPGAGLSRVGPDSESLRALIRPDIQPWVQTHGPDFPAIPPSMSGHGIEPAVEMQV